MLTVLRYEQLPLPLSTCFMATGRGCLSHLIERYMPERVVLPDMVPEGLIVPFEKAGVHVDHYFLNADLSPSLDSIKRVLKRSTAKRPLVVVVHYLGYVMPTAEAAVMAHAHGGLLLADSAHCLVNPDSENDCADLSLYSLNKLLPVPDGALLCSRSPEVDVSTPKELSRLDDETLNAYVCHLHANKLISMLPNSSERLDEALKQSHSRYDKYYAGISDCAPRSPSPLAQAAFHTDMHGIVNKRRANAKKIIGKLKPRQLFRRDTPIFAVPVRCRDAAGTKIELNAQGIAAAWFNTRWREPAVSSETYDFWSHHLLLPCTESLTPGEVERIGRTARWYA